MWLHEVLLDSLSFRYLGLHRLPAPLNFHPLAESPVHPLDSIIGRVRLLNPRVGDVLRLRVLESKLQGIVIGSQRVREYSLWLASFGVGYRILERSLGSDRITPLREL